MQIYATLDPTNTYPLELRSFIAVLDQPPPGMFALPAGKTIDDCAALMRVEGLWVPRPVFGKPVIGRTTTGFTIRVDPAPQFASCTIFDRDYGVILGEVAADDLVLVFEIADAGRYQLDFTAPLPWVGLTLNVVLE